MVRQGLTWTVRQGVAKEGRVLSAAAMVGRSVGQHQAAAGRLSPARNDVDSATLLLLMLLLPLPPPCCWLQPRS